MKSLELKVPPPALALTLLFAMWLLKEHAPGAPLPMQSWPTWARVGVAALIAAAGGGFSLAGLLAFRRAKTTVNPLKPQGASSLVTTGVYRFTRNPMYVALLLVLIGWAVFLCSAWALAGPLAFFLYIGRFQIAPEERVLTGLFGADYAAYLTNVRRWL